MITERNIKIISLITGIVLGSLTIWHIVKPSPDVVAYIDYVEIPIPAELKRRIDYLGTWDLEKIRKAKTWNEFNSFSDNEIESHLKFYKALLERRKTSIDIFRSLKLTKINITNKSNSNIKNVILRSPYYRNAEAQIVKETGEEITIKFTKVLELGDLIPFENIKVYIFQRHMDFPSPKFTLVHDGGTGRALNSVYVDNDASIYGGLYYSYKMISKTLFVVLLIFLCVALYIYLKMKKKSKSE